MRIAYLLERDVSRDDAVVKKVAAQIGCWNAQAHEVALFALTSGDGVAPALHGIDVDAEPWRRWRDWWTAYPRLTHRVVAWKPDVVYFRFSSYFPALRTVFEHAPTVIELNTDDRVECRQTMTRKARAYHLASRSRLFRKAAGLVAVTAELRDRYRVWNQPTAVVSNGIDLEAIVPLPAPQNERPRLVFLAQGTKPWHGVDKILALASRTPEWQFDMIGDDHVQRDPLPGNVTSHGFLDVDQYRQILAQADVAIGTLALHRNGMQEASPLKTREYLAYGIPTILGYRETDFPSGARFLLELPNTPDNLEANFARVSRFVGEARHLRVPRAEIKHLDVSCKEQQRTRFFESLVGNL